METKVSLSILDQVCKPKKPGENEVEHDQLYC